MSLPCWQKKVEQQHQGTSRATTPFYNAKKFFAVDASASTMGSIMNAQGKAVTGFHGNANDFVALWDHKCKRPEPVDLLPAGYFFGSGGTSPDCILREPAAVTTIKASDLWVLITDGEINDRSVTELTRLASVLGVVQVPVILLIVGGIYDSPDHTNISVGIPFFASAQEALILFKDHESGQIFVIDAKGAFEPLKKKGHTDLSSWCSLPVFSNEAAFSRRCKDLDLAIPQSDGHRRSGVVSLGTEWDTVIKARVDVSMLLAQQQIELENIRQLLGEEAITQLSLICKTIGQLDALRNLLLRHKQKEVIVRLEDRHGAGNLMAKLQKSVGNRDELMDLLRQAHTANRETYLDFKNHPSEEARLATDTNRLINRGLCVISSFEKSSYTADILNRKSNRAMRSKVVSAADQEIHLSALDLSSNAHAFRNTCSICCGEEQIMSVVLKELDTVEENTTDFALNFPLAAGLATQNANMISSQCICFQCALLIEKSIYQEKIVATIPSVDYTGSNKAYINHQLTLALTAGLATGVSGIVQLFMTILDRTLETKDWCSKANVEDTEVLIRRQVLDWTLQNLLRRCRTRENFAETGEWVDYPKALLWAINDFKEMGLDSWSIQYPVGGFNQLLRWYDLLQLPGTEANVKALQKAKLAHLTVTSIMNGLLHEENRGKSWTHPFLQIIFQEFNTPGIPRDLGSTSIVSYYQFWTKLSLALGPWQDVKRFLASFDAAARRAMVERIQLVAFWALYFQKGHTTPKTFFATIKSREPLALAVLDPTQILSSAAVRAVLQSIFCPSPQREDPHLGNAMPPFNSPFGPSVLHCGLPGCSVRFCSDADVNSGDLDQLAITVRERRAKHLADVYGVRSTFKSQTGLPDPTHAPKAPTSYHNNLHISTARTWSGLELKSKQAISNALIAKDEATIKVFIGNVQAEICSRNSRGDIYSATIQQEIREILPSLLEALRVASKKAGLNDKTGLSYEYDWMKNRIRDKVEDELSLQ